MTDIDNVLTGLECLITNEVPCQGCPYNGSGYCMKNIAKDALELLEPIEPIEERLDEVDSIYRCGNCKTHFYYRQQKYCAICGRMVKWNG